MSHGGDAEHKSDESHRDLKDWYCLLVLCISDKFIWGGKREDNNTLSNESVPQQFSVSQVFFGVS